MKVLLILPYLGKLPEYFPAFTHSLNGFRNENLIDVLIITDDDSISDYILPSFVRVQKTTYKTLDERFYSSCGARIYSSYKLCDYKPLYGSVFKEECRGYEYWGYCDVDTMLGDLVGWLNSINFTSYDRIGRYGHFTLYRNTPQITELWKNKVDGSITVDRVLRTTFPCYFDESGMNQICEASGIKFFSYNHVANVEALENLHFKTKEKLCQLFVWENGQTFIYSRKDGKIIKEEYAYIHYPYRKGLVVQEKLGDAVLLTHEGFYNFDINRIDEYFGKYGRDDNHEEHHLFHKSQYGKWKANRYKRFFFEIKRLGVLRTVMNITYRLRTTKIKNLFYRN